jgi:pyruvate/oxaloacetate carboxyltransferase
MDKAKRILNLTDVEDLRDADGYRAIDVTDFCFGDLDSDPWESLRAIRKLLPNSHLSLTLAGQCLVGYRHFSDEIVDAFVAAAVDNGIDTVKAYDPLNDARNLESVAKAAKKYGACLVLGMVYAESPVHSVPYFAGYAAQLQTMGADQLCICAMNNEFTCRELIESVKKSASLPLYVSAASDEIAAIAIDSGADAVENYDVESLSDELNKEIEAVKADAGYPPLARPIYGIIVCQAMRNLYDSARYETSSDDFKSLIRGGYGKTPAHVTENLLKDLCGSEPLILSRPADMIEPEYDMFREYASQWLEQDEDVLTYAIYRGAAIVYFENRKAKKYCLDKPHAVPSKGIHVI